MYNEALNIGPMVEMIRREAVPLLDNYEIVIVNDASTDGCGAIADQLAAADPHIRVIHHPQNRGLGGSIRTGLAAVRLQYALYSDSDLPVDFACLKWVLPQITPDIDLLIGHRLGRAEGARRAVMSWSYNRLIRTVFGLKVIDVNFAFKIFRRDLLQRLNLRSEGSFIDAEMLLEAHQAGCKLVEVGIQYQTRQAGVSSLSSPKVVVKILQELWGYLCRSRRQAFRGVIVNGDDFGLHPSVNHAIREAHCSGILTSTSLLAGGAAFDEAAQIARQEPELEVGVHFALTQVAPCAPAAQIPGLLDSEGRFPDEPLPVIHKIMSGKILPGEIEAEFRAQIERIQSAGVRITHLDSHQHLHVVPACAQIVARLANEYDIPAVRLPKEALAWPTGLPFIKASARFAQSVVLRWLTRRAERIFRGAGLAVPDHFLGFAQAGRMDRNLAHQLATLRPGITEIGCHPGTSTPELAAQFDWGYHWQAELAALRDEPLPRALTVAQARLASWPDCRVHAPRPIWARILAGNLVQIPMAIAFGSLGLLIAQPLDPVGLYATAAVLISLMLNLFAGDSPARLRRPLQLLSLVGIYGGLALLANSLWMALLALGIIVWRMRGNSVALPTRRAHSPRHVLLAALVILLLVVGFAIKEEYQEHRGHKPKFLGIHRLTSPDGSNAKSDQMAELGLKEVAP